MNRLISAILFTVLLAEVFVILGLVGIYAAPLWGVPAIIDPLTMRLFVGPHSSMTYAAGWLFLSFAVGLIIAERFLRQPLWVPLFSALSLAVPTAMALGAAHNSLECRPYPETDIADTAQVLAGFVSTKASDASNQAVKFSTQQMLEPAQYPGTPPELDRCSELSRIEIAGKEIARAASSFKCAEFSDGLGGKLRCDRPR